MLKKKILFKVCLSLLAICLLLSSAAVLGAAGALESGEAEKAVKITIDTADPQYAADREGLSEDTFIVFGVSPFPYVNETGGSLKNNVLGTWWNPWLQVELSYDFCTTLAIGGIGGVGFRQEDYTTLPHTEIVDQNGRPATCLEETYVEELANGWVRRTVRFYASQIIGEIYFTFGIRNGDLPDTGSFDVYYTNIKLKYEAGGNAEIDLFGNSASVYTAEQVNQVARGESVVEPYVKPEDQSVVTAWDYVKNFSDSEAAKNVSLGASFCAVDLPEVCSIELAMPDLLYQGESYDLLSFAQSSGAVRIAALEKDGQSVDIDGADLSAYVFTESGSYKVQYTATVDGYTARRSAFFVVQDGDKPIILSEDVRTAVPESGNAHEKIRLGKVFALVQGEKNLPAWPIVKNSAGKEFKVEQIDTGFEFTPTAKQDDVYHVVYTAENEGGRVVSETFFIQVTDVDKPVLDFSGLSDFVIGQPCEIGELMQQIGVEDLSDGKLGIAEISVLDPEGRELAASESFIPARSGEYRLTATTQPDSDGNVTVGTVTLQAEPDLGLVLGLKLEVPEAARAEGIRKSFYTQIANFAPSVEIEAGDVIRYEVMAYTVYGDGNIGYIPGVGAISAQVQGSFAGKDWPFIHTLFEEKVGVDQNGYPMDAKADLSPMLAGGDGPVWYGRTYTVREGDAICGSSWYHFMIAMDSSAACGESIFVFYRNVEICGPDGIPKRELWKGNYLPTREYTDEQNCTAEVFVTVDKAPVAVEGAVPCFAECGKPVSFPTAAMKDAATGAPVQAAFTVTAPDGANVSCEEQDGICSFVPDQAGIYVVTGIGSCGKFTSTLRWEIEVLDAEPPRILITPVQQTVRKGDTVTVRIEISDNVSSPEDFTELICVLGRNGERAEADMTQTPTGLTLSFVAEEGSYTVMVHGRDAAGLEAVETCVIPVLSSSDGARGCTAREAAVTLPVMAAGLCLLLFKRRR